MSPYWVPPNTVAPSSRHRVVDVFFTLFLFFLVVVLVVLGMGWGSLGWWVGGDGEGGGDCARVAVGESVTP